MKSTGIVRRIDDLGRVVLPKELRQTLHISEKDSLEIYMDDDKIILSKYIPSCTCIFCDEDNDLQEFRGKNVCASCATELSGR